MSRKTLPVLSAAEQVIMDCLWQEAPTGLQALLEKINEGRPEPIARATLQTQLSRLEAKGWIRRDSSGWAHQYRPAVPEAKGKRSALAEIKQRLFGGSSVNLVRCLVEGDELSEQELADLRQLVAEAERSRKEDA